MNRGAVGWKTLLFLVIIGAIIYGVMTVAPPFFHQACFKNRMEDVMRRYGSLGEDEMIHTIITVGRKDCKVPRLSYQNFDFEGDVLEDSVLRCHYTEVIKLPGGRSYELKMNPEVRIKIPAAF